MTKTAEIGRRGEDAAAEYLRQRGFILCERNWRSGRYEIDIIARREDELHFVEVKTRSVRGFTSPEEALTPLKCRAIRRAAVIYMEYTKAWGDPRFDLMAVDVQFDGSMQVRFIADAVESHW